MLAQRTNEKAVVIADPATECTPPAPVLEDPEEVSAVGLERN